MRLVPLIALAALFLGFANRPDEVAASPDSGAKAWSPGNQDGGKPGQKPSTDTQPTSKPAAKKAEAKGPSLDDQIKNLALKPTNLGSQMKAFESEKLEGKLNGWAKDGATDFDPAKKTGVKLAALSKAIEWKKSKKRAKDPSGFDEAVTAFEAATRKFAEAAINKDAAELKTSAEAVTQSCNNCHSKVKK